MEKRGDQTVLGHEYRVKIIKKKKPKQQKKKNQVNRTLENQKGTQHWYTLLIKTL